MWQLWLVLAGIFLVIEIINISFFIFWFSMGSLIAMVASFFIDNIAIQAAIFLVSSIALLFITKPFVSKILPKEVVKTNVYSLEGKKAIVTVDIEPLQNKGQIKVDGEIWSATTSDNSCIEKGSEVIIEKIEGVKTVVKKI